MNQTNKYRYPSILSAIRTVTVMMFVFIIGPAIAGEIQDLSWAPGDDATILAIRASEEASYQTESLDGGQKLRLIFLESTLSPTLNKLEGNQIVKGVFPYIAHDGSSVNIDLLLNQPGQIEVKKAANGYNVVVTATEATNESTVALQNEAPTADQNSIEDIVYAKLPGDRLQVTLRMSHPPTEPNSFSITNPARIAMDFAKTRVTATNRTLEVKKAALTSVTAIEVEGRTRVVFNLVKPVAYTTAVDNNNYVITLAAPTTAGAEPTKTMRFASTRKSGKFNLKTIDFRRGPLGDAKIIIDLSDPSIGVDIHEQAGEIILDFQNTSIPSELQRRLDVVDFATPVQTIDTFVQEKNTRMVITPKGKYEHIAYQTGNIFTVNIKPILEKPDEKKVDEFGYSGEKLSLNFQNIEARAALQVLADFTGLNFVISDTVTGSLTLRLKDVPWDQALDLIVDSKNLAIRRKGNVLTVAPAAEVAAKEKAAAEAMKSLIEIEPLVSELIQINYAKADDIAALLKSIKAVTTGAAQHPVFSTSTTGGGALAATDSNTLLSPRGQVTVDARTNSLLIQDTAGKVREVRKLITQLDQPVRQVLIESRLVEATDNFSRTIGARWGHLTDKVKGSTRQITSGKLEVLEPLINTNTFTHIPSGLSVNLPSPGIGTSAAGALTLAFVQSSRILELELSALEQEGKGKVISSPRVITANQKKAKIEQGQERVFTTSVLGVGTVVTKKATLKLEVTPQITPDDRINLEVDVTKDNFVDSVQGLLNVKQINTQVLLDNGETVVIGGIFERDQNTTDTKIPFFGDIPLLGWLFKNREVKDNKTELLIFLTPRIVSENFSLR